MKTYYEKLGNICLTSIDDLAAMEARQAYDFTECVTFAECATDPNHAPLGALLAKQRIERTAMLTGMDERIAQLADEFKNLTGDNCPRKEDIQRFYEIAGHARTYVRQKNKDRVCNIIEWAYSKTLNASGDVFPEPEA